MQTAIQHQEWIYSEQWVCDVLKTVAKQVYRRVGRHCFLCADDIHHDLIEAVFVDRMARTRLSGQTDEGTAKKMVYKIADPIAKRLARRYLRNWGLLTYSSGRTGDS